MVLDILYEERCTVVEVVEGRHSPVVAGIGCIAVEVVRHIVEVQLRIVVEEPSCIAELGELHTAAEEGQSCTAEVVDRRTVVEGVADDIVVEGRID